MSLEVSNKLSEEIISPIVQDLVLAAGYSEDPRQMHRPPAPNKCMLIAYLPCVLRYSLYTFHACFKVALKLSLSYFVKNLSSVITMSIGTESTTGARSSTLSKIDQKSFMLLSEIKGK
ncbi:3518_t:CDS:2 [Funneliformis mosseae]|uniref:3518_t:CDS:1 n=1 Tax=Funneliformis mosseae TaxID=27381 RepID=A0A9N9GZ35_FUNMO|nr:3518_t:CDS:2 [Funneliformis mosseae]